MHSIFKSADFKDLHDSPFLKMHFELHGFGGYEKNSKKSIDVVINQHCHQLFFFPEVKGKLNYTAQPRYTMEIKLTTSFLKRLFGEDLAALQKSGKAVQKNKPAIMIDKNLPILPAMRNVIYQIINCSLHSSFRKVYIEAKVAELLTLQLDQLSKIETEKPQSIFRQADIDKIYFAQELIEKNIEEPCSLLELAEKAGLNDFKLKKGFKEVFGNTVFGYMTDVRMEKAKSLLLEGSLTIADISFMVGYKNPQHFTAAFKRKFGYLPSQLKK